HGQQPPERIVGPLELFYDLVVVVLIGQATRHLSGHLAWRGLGEYAAVFALVWIAWVDGSPHAGPTACGRSPAAPWNPANPSPRPPSGKSKKRLASTSRSSRSWASTPTLTTAVGLSGCRAVGCRVSDALTL